MSIILPAIFVLCVTFSSRHFCTTFLPLISDHSRFLDSLTDRQLVALTKKLSVSRLPPLPASVTACHSCQSLVVTPRGYISSTNIAKNIAINRSIFTERFIFQHYVQSKNTPYLCNSQGNKLNAHTEILSISQMVMN